MRKAKEPWAFEIMWMRCIHRYVKEYQTKVVPPQLLGHSFTCWVGIVSQIDCLVLMAEIVLSWGNS